MLKKYVVLVIVFLLSLGAYGASFPNRNITLVVPYSAGGGSDQVSRALAKIIQEDLKKPVTIVNRVGAGGGIGMSYGARSRKDGYTVTMLAPEITILPYTGGMKISYKDFDPLTIVNSSPSVIAVKSDSEFKTIEDFINYAKKNPNKIRVGNSGVGSIWHLATAQLGKVTKTQLTPVPFAGAAPAVAALLGGHIEATSVSYPEVQAQVASGDLRILATMSENRLAGIENVPTLKEKGYDVVVKTWRGYAVPKGTSNEVKEVLENAFIKAAKTPEFKTFMNRVHQDITIVKGEQFKEQMTNEDKTYEQLLTELNLKR